MVVKSGISSSKSTSRKPLETQPVDHLILQLFVATGGEIYHGKPEGVDDHH